VCVVMGIFYLARTFFVCVCFDLCAAYTMSLLRRQLRGFPPKRRSISDTYCCRQRLTWGRWERIRALQNKAFYITSTPPPGQNRQPPLTLFDFDQLLLGIERVPYVDHIIPVLMFDGPAFEVRNFLNVNVPVLVVPAGLSVSLSALDQFPALDHVSDANLPLVD
jgi:hypothetical protein